MPIHLEVIRLGHNPLPVGALVTAYGWSRDSFLVWYDDQWMMIPTSLVKLSAQAPEGDPAQFLQANRALLDAVAEVRLLPDGLTDQVHAIEGAIRRALDELADFAGQAGIEGFRHPDASLVNLSAQAPEGGPAHFLQANGDLLDALAGVRTCIHRYVNPTRDELERSVEGAILHALDELADFAGQAGIEGFRHPDATE